MTYEGRHDHPPLWMLHESDVGDIDAVRGVLKHRNFDLDILDVFGGGKAIRKDRRQSARQPFEWVMAIWQVSGAGAAGDVGHALGIGLGQSRF